METFHFATVCCCIPSAGRVIIMSFFNVTQLGVQDHIKTCVKNPGTYPRSISSSGEAAAQIPLRTTLSEPVYPNSEANGSHVKYTERLHKHIRPKLGTNEIYKKQVTSNCEYSWWMKDGVQKEPWTHNDRHARVNSEMTRFVDEMTLTNRDFTLF